MQYPPKLIVIHGLKGSGKDLTAKMLIKYALNSDTFAFASKLKRLCSVAWELPLEYFNDVALKEKVLPNGMTPRAMMTGLQGPIKDAFGEDFFALHLHSAWTASREKGRNLIVTDLRFPVELKVCRELQANVVHVLRPHNGIYAYSDHVSEHGIQYEPSDLILDNARDKAYLLTQVRDMVRTLWGPDALKSYPYNDRECLEFN